MRPILSWNNQILLLSLVLEAHRAAYLSKRMGFFCSNYYSAFKFLENVGLRRGWINAKNYNHFWCSIQISKLYEKKAPRKQFNNSLQFAEF